MYHSITIGDKNTYDDWHLVSIERPSVQPPEAVTTFITIPGMNGSLDISEALTGYPTYGRRKGSWEFTILNDYETWDALYRKMANYLHNKKYTVKLEDERSMYYEGRLFVTKWKSDTPNSKITVEYELMPYKKDITKTDDKWLWDPFSFQYGVITQLLFGNISITSDTEWTKMNITPDLYGEEPCCPTFKVTSTSGNGMAVRYVSTALNIDMTETLTDGDNVVPEIILMDSDISLYFKGKGTVSISYNRGML